MMTRVESLTIWVSGIDADVDPKKSALNNWIDVINSSPYSTWKIYVRGLRFYCIRWGITPQELYLQRCQEIEPKKSPEDYLMKGQIKRNAIKLMQEIQQDKRDNWPEDLRKYITAGSKSASTCNMVSKALTSFFSVFGDKLALKFNIREKVKGVSEGSDNISPEQIKMALDFSGDEFTLRNKAIVLFLKDSGLRSSDIGLIKTENYHNALRKRRLNRAGEPFALLDPIITQKEKIPANIIIGPETLEALDRYMRSRSLAQVERRDTSEALFIMRPSKRGDLRESTDYVAISAAAVAAVVKRMIDRALGAESSTRTTHSLRNFHYNTLQYYADIPEDAIKWLQGKKQNTYHRGNAKTEEIFSKYMDAYDKLRVYSTPPPSEEDLQDLQRQINKIKNQRTQDISTLLTDIESLQKIVRSLFDRREREGREALNRMAMKAREAGEPIEVIQVIENLAAKQELPPVDVDRILKAMSAKRFEDFDEKTRKIIIEQTKRT